MQGLGPEAGAPLVAHPGMARIAFTGSVATGRSVAAAAAAQLTPLSLELGGKSPLIVFADADFDLAVRHAVEQFDNAGQVCLAGTRLLVDEPIAGEFTARFTVRAAALRQGDPRDEATDIGPNITRAHLDRVDGFVRRALAAGARPLPAGRSTPASAACTTSPPCSAARHRARRSSPRKSSGRCSPCRPSPAKTKPSRWPTTRRYGLAATCSPATRTAPSGSRRRLLAGTVWVNCFFVRDLAAPFGGIGLSGIGREGGTWSFDFYSDVKNTVYAGQGWSADG